MTHCININHPDYVDLRNESGLHEDILKAKIAIWMKENGTDKIPSAEELDILPIKNKYLQLASNLVNPAIEELDNYLLDFLKNFNVKSKQFEELKSRLGVNALGATDILNKLIWYVKNRNEETLSEESAHMLVALMGENHSDIRELLANITNWSEYNNIKDQYLPIYKDEEKVKIEAVGKLIAKALVKNYKLNGLDKNKLQKVLDKILNFIEEILNSMNFSNVFMYNESVADHIAINILSGNKDYIYKIKNINPNVNAKKEISNNPNAKKIINKFSSNNVKLTGSLAIAGTENIRRPEGKGIHDLDFKVKSFEVFNKEVLSKIPDNAVPAHFGWHKKSYSTFAYLIPSEGYRIEVLERKDDFSNGWITNYKLYNEKDEEVEITQSNVIALDFFVYKEDSSQKDFEFSSDFIPASLVYEGKISLGGKSNPYFFSRDKDQEDYVLRNPKSFIPFENHIYYQLSNKGDKAVSTPEDYVSTTNIKKSSNINQVSDNLKDFLSGYNNYTIAQEDNSFVIMSKGGNPQIILKSPDGKPLFIRISNNLYKSMQKDENINILDYPVYEVKLNTGSTMFVIGEKGSIVLPMPELNKEDDSPKSKLTPEQNEIFTRLQNAGLVSKKTFSFEVQGKTKRWYFIPKAPIYSQASTIYSKNTTSDYKKDYRKKQILDDMIEKNGWTFIRTRETENAIHVEIGDFAGQFPTRYESKATAPNLQSTPSSSITKQKILTFLKNIGFTDIQIVKKLFHNGKEIEEDAYLDMINGVMQIVEGKEDVTLPEEAMHILVELIQQSDPVLFRKLEQEVIDYQLYRDLVNSSYATDPNYTKDGKPNYAKLKKEAIAKVLVEYMIGSDNASLEALSKIKKINSWWAAIKDWIRRIFTKYQNPFKEALNKLEEDNESFGVFSDLKSDELFFAKSSKSLEERDKEFEKTKDTFTSIKDSAFRLGFSKIDHEYYKDGKLWEGKRVTSLVEDFKNSLFRNKPSDPEKRAYYDSLAKDGQYIHSVFEDVFNSMVDGETGLVKDIESSLTEALYPSEIERLIARQVKGYMRRMLSTFPEGTRFLSETIVYSEKKNLIGTVDFIAIEPNGKTSVLDWKTVQSEAEERDYKKQQWEIQLSAYKEILKDNGIKEFGRLRAIPVLRVYKKDGNLKELMLGDVDPLKEESRVKRPYISAEESTGNEMKDRLIIKLKGVYATFVNMLKSGKLDSRLILDEINNAIFDLQVGKDLRHVTAYVADLHTKVKKLSKEIDENTLKDVDTLNGFIGDINIYKGVFAAISDIQGLVVSDKTVDVVHRDKLRLKFNDLSDRMSVIDNQLIDLLDIIAKENGVFNLPSPEKVVRGFSVHLRAMGDHDIASIRLMYELVKNAYSKIDMETDEELKNLKALKYSFDNFVKSSGMKYQDAISLLVNKETGRLYSKISKDFYEKRKEVQASNDAKTILNFVNTNYDMTKWKEWYDKELADNIKLWESGAMSEDPAENRRIIKIKKAKFEKEYNILKNPKTAFHVYNKMVWSRNLNEELWESDEFKTIKNNPVLNNIYNFFVKKNKELVEIGAIAEYEAYTFIPNVLKGASDIFSVKDTNVLNKVANLSLQAYRNWKRKISVSDYQLNFQGKIDKSTGEKIEERFIPYIDRVDNNYDLTVEVANEIVPGFKEAKKEDKWNLLKKFKENEINNKLFGEKIASKRNMSFDIFTIYGLMSKEIAKEKYLQKSDDIFRGLRHFEKSKTNFATNKYGKVTYQGDRPELSAKVGENYSLFEKYYRYFVGGELLQMDSDYSVKFSLKKLWNKLPIGEQYKFEITDDDNAGVSVSKFLLWLNNSNTLKTLGLNFSSALSNLFGSQFSAGKLYSSKISVEDLNNAWGKITSVGFYQNEQMKKQAALVDFFLPLLNNREGFKAEQLSVAQASKILSQDWLMWPQRKGDEIVQLNLFFAFIENTGIIDKQLVNLREKAKSEVVPEDYYKKTPEERKQIDKKFNERLKELKEKYNITKLAEYKKVNVNGKEETIISLPDVERNSKQVADFRAQIQTMSKDATGSADEFDFQTYRLHMIGRLAGTFKNWIPRMGDVRWADLHYSQSHQAYVYGRFRMLYRGFTSNMLASMVKTIPLPWITGKVFKNVGREDLIKRAVDVYQKKKEEIEKLKRGEEFMSEREFVDMFLTGFENSMAEVRIFTFLTLFILFGLMKGGPDDEPEDKAMKALVRRQIDKMSDEVGFFFNPPSIIDIAKNPFPIMMYVNDIKNLSMNFGKEMFGLTEEAMGFEEQGADVRKRAKPMKYLFKVLPVLKEIINYMPAYDSELGNDWGVKIADKRGI